MKGFQRFLAAALTAAALILCLPSAAAESPLTIRLGYAGWSAGEYVETSALDWAKLAGDSLPVHTAWYSGLSDGKAGAASVRGVYLRDLLEYLDVDAAGTGLLTSGGDSFSLGELLEEERYYYPALTRGDGADGAVRAEPMLALEDYVAWDVSGEELEERDPARSADGFGRLYIGQRSPEEEDTLSEKRDCGSLLVTLPGAPELRADADALELEPGQSEAVTLDVSALNTALGTYIREHAVWRSSDESVATVDDQGNVTLVGPGEAAVTAFFHDASVTVIVRGTGEPDPSPEPSQEPEPSPSPSPSPKPSPSPSPKPSPSAAPAASPSPSPGGEGEIVNIDDPAERGDLANLPSGLQFSGRPSPSPRGNVSQNGLPPGLFGVVEQEPEEDEGEDFVFPEGDEVLAVWDATETNEAVARPSRRRVVAIAPGAMSARSDRRSGYTPAGVSNAPRVPIASTPRIAGAAALLAFLLGFVWEMIRFRRLLRGR